MLIVLGSLLLMSFLVVAFLNSVSTELQNSKISVDQNGIRMLRDAAVNVVMTQIRSATTENAGDSWASQPGAIRLFDTSGKLAKAYKLYSSDTMVDTRFNPVSEATALTGWQNKPALFVDLNKPVSGVYPIADPAAAQGSGAVEGFSVAMPPGATSSSPLPMPAKWLYLLQDGTFASASGNGTTATVTGATQENPIVGRIAFWTDDETCKVNVNTASEGIAWDTPRFEGPADRALASYQPANGEFQRYPGHPAGVCLSTVFPSLAADTATLYSWTPRIVGGGSNGGTQAPTAPLVPDTDRLYATVDDFAFAATSRKAQPKLTPSQLEKTRFFLTTSSRAPELNLFGLPRISIWPVHAALATNPTTPYATAYDRLSAFCSTLGAAANQIFYFQRKNADSPTDDYQTIPRNQQLYSYLQNLTAREIPGFGGNFLKKYGDDRDQILTEIFDYIRCTNLFDDNLGTPVSLTSFYQYTRPRNLTKVGYTTPGHGQVAPIQIGSTMGMGRYYSLSEIGLHLICTADGNGVASTDPNSALDPKTASNLAVSASLNSGGKAVGTNYVSPATPATLFPANPTLADTYLGAKVTLLAGSKRLQAALIFEVSSVMPGWEPLDGDFDIEISGLENFVINGQRPFATSSNGTLLSPVSGVGVYKTTVAGGENGFRYVVAHNKNGGNDRVNGWSNPASTVRYPFVSNPFTITGNTVSFSGSGITVKLYVDGNGGTRTLVQTLQLTFPAANGIAAPDLIVTGLDETTAAAANWWGFDKRVALANANPGSSTLNYSGSFIRANPATLPSSWRYYESSYPTANPYTGYTINLATNPSSDVVRTLVPLSGDLRLVAGQASVDTTKYYQKNLNYDDTTAATKLAHSFIEAAGWAIVGMNRTATLVSGAAPAYLPHVPGDVSAAAANGDWDTAVPGVSDGPYANKPDEGNTATPVPYFSSWSTVGLPNFFTPNRILPSPGVFGSLPTGVKAGIPWKTLLFRPQPTHPANATAPKDHLIMDLFTMPQVEPFAISERLSTTGKINMNYQIVPYTYITRSTAVRAAMKSEQMAAVLTTAGKNYKSVTTFPSPRTGLNLSDVDGSLRGFAARFANGDIFRSATEICDLYFVPSNQSWTSDAAATAFWTAHGLTGDNVRERPYADLYSRLTTKSNSYQVHYFVQALKKRGGSAPALWENDKDVVLGEERGSVVLERYLDTTNAALPDFASQPQTGSLESYYKFRVGQASVFNP
ncbi:Verru_Chthon cassette protein A [Verrucomicrobium sp. GAS474]|nr:Verru_Chthon cassette protein A [Verrucomicrobium sp. GAS474]